MSRRRRVVVPLVVMILTTTAACTGPSRAPTGAAPPRAPVVFVHGYISSPAMWRTMRTRFQAAGYRASDLSTLGYDSTALGPASGARALSTALAGVIDQALERSRRDGDPAAAKVDIVSHSYGSMITRYCIALGDCAGKVDHWMSLAGADGGTALGLVPASLGQGSGDMAPDSAMVSLLKRPENIQSIKDQGVKVEVQWSSGDGVIIPATNSQWPAGAANPDPTVNRRVAATINHLTIYTNAGVITETIRFLGT